MGGLEIIINIIESIYSHIIIIFHLYFNFMYVYSSILMLYEDKKQIQVIIKKKLYKNLSYKSVIEFQKMPFMSNTIIICLILNYQFFP